MVADEVNVSIRPIRDTDFQAIFNLAWNLVSPEELAYLIPESPTSLCFVAEAEGSIIGFNLANMMNVGIPLSKICIIQGIVVHDDYRRLGIGEKLIEAVLEKCNDCGIRTIRALVEESDFRLLQFVEHLGFLKSSVANFDKATNMRVV